MLTLFAEQRQIRLALIGQNDAALLHRVGHAVDGRLVILTVGDLGSRPADAVRRAGRHNGHRCR